MLKAIAIDDEPIALEVIKSHSGKIPFIHLENCFTNAFEAMDHIRKGHIDLIFLDIKMPDISGIDLVKAMPDPPMVIFTTAYSEHAVQSFELDAIDYLLKPFSLPRFLKACNKANEQFELKRHQNPVAGQPVYVYIKSGYGAERVELEELLYVESSGNYMRFVLEDRKILSRLTMHETEALLAGSGFLRINRSFIVSKKRIGRIEKKSVWIGPVELPVGAAYAQEIEKMIKPPDL